MRKFWHVLCGLMCVLWCLPIAHAQETLTVDEAVATALENNVALQAETSRLGLFDARIVTAGTPQNPSLMSDNGVSERSFRLGIQKLIVTGGKRRRQVELAQAEREVILAEIARIRQETVRDVRKAYIQLYWAEQQVEVFQTALNFLESRLRSSASPSDASGQLAVLMAMNRLTSVEEAQEDARLQLSQLMNRRVSSVVRLMEPPRRFETVMRGIPLLEGRTGYLQSDLLQHPELQENHADLQVADRLLALTKALRIPNFNFATGADYVTGSPEVLGMFFIGMVELPVFDRQQGPIQEAQAMLTHHRQEQAAITQALTSRAHRAYAAAYFNYGKLMRYENEILPRLQSMVEASSKQTQPSSSEVTLEALYQDVRLGYLDTVRQYHNALVDLDTAIGNAP